MVEDFLSITLLRNLSKLEPSFKLKQVQRICEIIREILSRRANISSPLLTNNFIRQPKIYQYSRLYKHSHVADRRYLFIRNINNQQPIEAKQYILAFYIKRDIFYTFFRVPIEPLEPLARSLRGRPPDILLIPYIEAPSRFDAKAPLNQNIEASLNSNAENIISIGLDVSKKLSTNITSNKGGLISLPNNLTFL